MLDVCELSDVISACEWAINVISARALASLIVPVSMLELRILLALFVSVCQPEIVNNLLL